MEEKTQRQGRFDREVRVLPLRAPCAGTDAPICQDTRSGGLDDLLASAEIGHDALVDLAREETFQAPDDLTFGAAVGRTSHNVVDRWLVVPHADDDRPIEGGVGLAVTAPVEAVPPSGPPGRGGDGTRATELREGGLRANPLGVVAEDNQELGRAVGAHPEPRPEGGRRLGRESREVPVVCGDFLGARANQRRASARRVSFAEAVGVSRRPGRRAAQRASRR